MWKSVYEKQKTNPTQPKAEWAYINFIKHFLAYFPTADRDTVMLAWHIERNTHISLVKKLLKL